MRAKLPFTEVEGTFIPAEGEAGKRVHCREQLPGSTGQKSLGRLSWKRYPIPSIR